MIMEPMMKFASIICMLAGLALYLTTLNPKINRVGEIMFAVGLFITLWKL